MLHGEQGSAKSTLQELVKMLIDPSIINQIHQIRQLNPEETEVKSHPIHGCHYLLEEGE